MHARVNRKIGSLASQIIGVKHKLKMSQTKMVNSKYSKRKKRQIAVGNGNGIANVVK
jgi:hypothetical protein